MEQGIEVVTYFLNKQLLSNHQDILKQVNLDYKTLFQEKAQTHGTVLIEYRLISKKGPDHNQIFEMGLFVDDKLISRGKGNSKKTS